MATYILALQFAKVRGEISDETYKNMIAELQTIPDKIAKILEDKERIQWFASKQANAHDVFFVGRGIDYAICMEGSLKMKEISYIHSEAYAAGELKHGTISLIEDDILVIRRGLALLQNSFMLLRPRKSRRRSGLDSRERYQRNRRGLTLLQNSFNKEKICKSSCASIAPVIYWKKLELRF